MIIIKNQIASLNKNKMIMIMKKINNIKLILYQKNTMEKTIYKKQKKNIKKLKIQRVSELASRYY